MGLHFTTEEAFQTWLQERSVAKRELETKSSSTKQNTPPVPSTSGTIQSAIPPVLRSTEVVENSILSIILIFLGIVLLSGLCLLVLFIV